MSAAEFLDELDAAREKATPGPWAATSPRADGGAYIDPPRPRRTSDGVCWVGHTEAHADAEAIVTAVNALPKLTAALRGVLDLADDWDRNAAIFPEYGDLSAAAARSIRTAITAALSPAQPQSGDRP